MLYLGFLFYGLGLIAGIASLVCFVMVVIEMFKRQQTGIAIATLIGIPCGYGGILALIYGWMKATEWNLKKVMMIYTGTFLASILLYVCGGVFMGMGASAAAGDFGKQMEIEMKKQQDLQKKKMK
jgi:hypothetical protein